jgi:tetratricopeptide (TPR) repeat protein
MIFNRTHTTGISVMFKSTVVSSLTLISVLLATATTAHAELAPRIDSLTIQNIERSQETPEVNNDDSRQAANHEQSMKYVQLGWAAQKKGEKEQALVYYDKALKLEETNAYAFMAVATLLGGTKDGITCMKAALVLFERQENTEGVEIASAWLREYSAN